MKRIKKETLKKPKAKKTPKSFRDLFTKKQLAERDKVCWFRDPTVWVEAHNPNLADALALR